MPTLSIFGRKPLLALLTASQLLDLAREFRALALAASTTEVQQSLEVRAVRYAVLAAKREIEDRRATRH